MKARKWQLLLGILLCLTIACKKQETQEYLGTSAINELKTIVQRFRESFNQTATVEELRRFQKLTDGLDYEHGSKLSLGTDSTLSVVRLQGSPSSKAERFIGIVKYNDTYSFDGIYRARNLGSIQSALTGRSLPPRDSVVVRGLDGYPKKSG